MTAKTHIHGGFTALMILYPLLVRQLAEVTFINIEIKHMYYCLCFVLGLAGARYGTMYPDFDHNSKKSIPIRNGFSYILWHILKFFGATHRSWHTHAADVNLIIFGIPTYYIYKQLDNFNTLSIEYYIYFLFYVLALTFLGSVLMHLLLDLFTIGGGYISIIISYMLYKMKKKVNRNAKLSDFKITLSPTFVQSLGLVKDANFGTGGAYENGFRKLLTFLNYVGGLFTIYYMYFY